MQVKVGDMVVWESQAQGVWKKKSGRVIAIVPAGASIEEVWPEAKNIPKSRKKWSDEFSKFPRAIVEVPRKKVPLYYAPRLSWLKRG